MEKLMQFIRTIVGINETDLQIVLSKFRKKRVPKGKLILKKGQVASQYLFIVSGGLRIFYEGEKNENTTWMVLANEFFTEISSLNP